MSKKRRWLAMLSIASLFIAVGGCSDDDDPIQTQQVNQELAEEVAAGAMDFLLEFGSDIADLIEAANAPKAGNMGRQIECAPIPGLESDFFCTVPANGEICPVDETTTQWVFSNCMETGVEPGIVDGTVTVTESGNVYNLDFNLDVDDGTIDGSLQVELGDPCVSLTYTDLEFDEDGVSVTLNETITLCDSGPSGSVSATVSATGFQRFIMDLSFPQGIPTIVITSATTMEPLFSCTYNPITESASCFPW